MAIRFQVLGQPEDDNALWVEHDSGQAITRLLFDCGEQCLGELSLGQIQQFDHVFFSHLHVDHISGFDSLFRCVYAREVPIQFWGPANTGEILQHRFQGFWWNLVEAQPGSVLVHSVGESSVQTDRFQLSEKFSKAHRTGERETGETLLDNGDFSVKVLRLEHRGVSLGYRVEEKPRENISSKAMSEMGLAPGKWISELKSKSSGNIQIQGKNYEVNKLRQQLLRITEGDSIAYLTDFILDTDTEQRLVEFLDGCRTVVCEAHYRKEDLELASRNCHATTDQVSALAAKANVSELILFHLSDRYTVDTWMEMLEQAKTNFPNTRYPDSWFAG